MLEKPNLQDDQIIAALSTHYDLPVTHIEFLPIGNDATAWVYRVNTDDGQTYFLKVKRQRTIFLPSVSVPQFLKAQGIQQVVAPLVTTARKRWANVDKYSLLLYPFIEGRSGMEAGLSDNQWREFGAVLRRIHNAHPPPKLAITSESFTTHWSSVIDYLRTFMKKGQFDDPYQRELAAFWAERHGEIIRIVTRCEELGRTLQKESRPFVLCHTDIHTANILLDSEGRLHIVDWDTPLLAPKERDLMFIGDDITATTHTQKCFYEGYGEVTVDPVALAYYRYEWVVQEIGDYGERVFLADSGAETRADSVRGFRQLFAPGDVVDVVYRCEKSVPPGV